MLMDVPNCFIPSKKKDYARNAIFHAWIVLGHQQVTVNHVQMAIIFKITQLALAVMKPAQNAFLLQLPLVLNVIKDIS